MRSELREYLRERLPEYMIPQAIVKMEKMPLTPNGKIDRQGLPTPDYISATRMFVAPKTETEIIVAEIWAEVLNIDEISAEDNFFSIGGHSLLATQVVSRLRQRLKTEIPLRTLFESSTVTALAKAIDSNKDRQSQPETQAITPRARVRQSSDKLLEKLQRLSESEALRLLSEMKQAKSKSADNH